MPLPQIGGGCLFLCNKNRIGTIMEPYLTTFEEIQAKAKRLQQFTAYRIKKMDIEVYINLYCAYAKWIGDNLAMYCQKYKYCCTELRLERLTGKAGYCDGKEIVIDFKTLYSPELSVREILLHELAHTIYNHHEIEFWNQLASTLKSEKLITKIPVFEIKSIKLNYSNCFDRALFCNGELFGVYYQSKNACSMRSCGHLTSDKTTHHSFVLESWLHNRKSMSAIMSRIFDVKGNRKISNSLMPIWDSYFDYYGLDSMIPRFTS